MAKFGLKKEIKKLAINEITIKIRYKENEILKFTTSFPVASIKSLSFFCAFQSTKGMITPANGNKNPNKADKCIKKALVASLVVLIVINFNLFLGTNIHNNIVLCKA